MFKKWRSCLSLLVCVCFILSMLFLNTLEVEARDYYGATQTISHLFTVGLESSPYVYSSTVLDRPSGTTYHIIEPMDFQLQIPSDFNVDLGAYYYVAFNPVTFSIQNTISTGSVYSSNFIVRDANGNVLSNSGTYNSRIYKIPIQNGSRIFEVIGSSYYYTYPLTVEYDLTVLGNMNYYNIRTDYSWSLYVRLASSDEVNQTQTPVTDIGANSKLENIESSSQSVADSVTNPDPNGKGLFETISDFFGSFFDNIINSFKSLFIPEDGFFTDWFTMLNTLLEAKLGMLYAPFGLIISLLTAIMSADSTEVGIPIPEIAWTSDGVKTVLIEAQTFTFSSLGENFNDLRDKVYFATDTVIIFAFLMLLQAKVRHIINGHESG